ncbi:MAG: L-histidine N(alpha)-methyltransferase, partial [Gemmatimonadaceae bacterium]
QPSEAAEFLAGVRNLVGSDGAMILGVDRVKDKLHLDAAYNDSAGLTAAFNMNMLARINRDLHAEFDLDSFEHVAFFNTSASRIEMHLRSLIAQVICVAGEPITFAAGETIWTESSYKYSEDGLRALVAAGGFSMHRLWTDEEENFWVAYLSP